MRLIILWNETRESFDVEISDELTVNDLRAIIEAETNIVTQVQALYHNGVLLINNNVPISKLNFTDNGIIILTKIKGNRSSTAISIDHDLGHANLDKRGGSSRSEDFSPSSNDPSSRIANTSIISDEPNSKNSHRLVRNPTDRSNSEAKMLETIRRKQVEENLQLAFDISPESFVAVNLLYIKLRINGCETYALVDTGAQTTVLHPSLARQFGISELIDQRFASMTVGVGSKHSEGRIHSVPVSLGNLGIEVPCSFTILDIHVGILFGLDMLRRHKCTVDLSRDLLVIGDKEVKFLTDHEIETLVVPSQIKSGLSSKKVPAISERDKAASSSTSSRAAETFSNSTRTSHENSYPESSIARIIALGFTRKEALEALNQAGGNVELAASSLF